MHEYLKGRMKDENERQLTDRILSGAAVETEYEDDIVCPWCDTRYDSFDVDENYLFMDEGTHVTHCYECDHDFTYQANVSITFSTRRL
ncbi:hypothetical protein [Streptococcus hyovaginalis]